MKCVTRENAKVDRIACPWLIKRFVDERAEFLFVPKEDVMRVASESGAVPSTFRALSWGMSTVAARLKAS